MTSSANSPSIPAAPPLAVGGVFVDALRRRDFEAMAACLAPDVRFRALLPRRDVDVVGPDAAIAEFRRWFGDESERCDLLDATVGAAGPRLYMSWRVRMTRLEHAGPDSGARIAEQHAYANGDDTLTTFSLLCSGFAPA
jgi:ketosteroid isomerase-like protein